MITVTFGVACDACRKQLMGVFEELHQAVSAASRAGWFCELGGDVLCPACRRVEPGTVLPAVAA